MHIADLLATLWLRFFKINPKATLLTTVIMMTVAAAALQTLSDFDKARRNLLLNEKNNNYQAQVVQLNETEHNIKNLLTFVQAQKDSLRETEETLQKLKSERDKIQPLLQLDKSTLETIFKVQEERANANVWRERGIGFISGLLASLLASFVWTVGSTLFKK